VLRSAEAPQLSAAGYRRLTRIRRYLGAAVSEVQGQQNALFIVHKVRTSIFNCCAFSASCSNSSGSLAPGVSTVSYPIPQRTFKYVATVQSVTDER
jgi:hypothetical protein